MTFSKTFMAESKILLTRRKTDRIEGDKRKIVIYGRENYKWFILSAFARMLTMIQRIEHTIVTFNKTKRLIIMMSLSKTSC